MRWPWARSPSASAVGVDPLDRLLARGIDRRDEHHVGVVEGVLEVLHQVAQAGEAVRLDHRDDPLLRRFARRRQHRADLDRVMGIIVDDRRAVDLADLVKRRLTPVKLSKPAGQRRIVHPELEPDRDRRQRVQHIVPARHRHEHALDQPPLAVDAEHRHVEPAAAIVRLDIVGAKVGQRRRAIGDDPPVADPAEDALHLGMVDAHHREPVEGHILDELDEGVLDRVEAAIMLEMLGIDVGDDRDRPVEPQEAAVALVGLDHHPVGRCRAARWSHRR